MVDEALANGDAAPLLAELDVDPTVNNAADLIKQLAKKRALP